MTRRAGVIPGRIGVYRWENGHQRTAEGFYGTPANSSGGAFACIGDSRGGRSRWPRGSCCRRRASNARRRRLGSPTAALPHGASCSPLRASRADRRLLRAESLVDSIHMRDVIRTELAAIVPLDAIEREHLSDALGWVDSGAELIRVARPATPPKHLVSYFVVVDVDHVLLVDHRNAQLWLPSGGHVERDEHPRTTVLRELQEELGFSPNHDIGAPLMVTCTATVGLTAGHTDVSLWYVVRAPRSQPITFDETEFAAVRWFGFSEVPVDRSEPHLRRFIRKLLASSS